MDLSKAKKTKQKNFKSQKAEQSETASYIYQESITAHPISVKKEERQYIRSKSNQKKPINLTSYISSSSSESCILKNIEAENILSSDELRNLSKQMKNIGEILMKLAISMETNKLNEQNLSLLEISKVKSEKDQQENNENLKKSQRFRLLNHQVVENYPTNSKIMKPFRNRRQKIKEFENENLKYSMYLDNSLNPSLSEENSNFRRQFHNNINELHPENYDTEHMAAKDGISNRRKKKVNKSGKMGWRFEDINFINDHHL